MATDVFPINGTSRKIYMILSCPHLVSFCAAPTFHKHLQEAETETRRLFEASSVRSEGIYRFPWGRRDGGEEIHATESLAKLPVTREAAEMGSVRRARPRFAKSNCSEVGN